MLRGFIEDARLDVETMLAQLLRLKSALLGGAQAKDADLMEALGREFYD